MLPASLNQPSRLDLYTICASRNVPSADHHSSGCHERGHHFKGLNASESPGGHIDMGVS